MKKIKDFLRDLVDPEGPIGQIVSPSITYKDRQGVGLSSPRAFQAKAEAAHIDFDVIQKACAPERFVKVGEGSAPKSRTRQVSLYIEEEWTPDYEASTGDSYLDVITSSGVRKLLGWNVIQRPRNPYCDCERPSFGKDSEGRYTHRACGRGRPRLSNEQIVEIAKSVQMQPGDTHYERYAETIPGNDVGEIGGQRVKGGTWIRSRKHYNQLTKGFVHWDAGVPAKIEEAKAEQAAKRKHDLARKIEVNAHRLVSDRPGDL